VFDGVSFARKRATQGWPERAMAAVIHLGEAAVRRLGQHDVGASMLDLKDGKIVHQTVVQAFDE